MHLKTAVVQFTKFASKQTEKLPREIAEKLSIWKLTIELLGLREMRKTKGYHDEPLKGKRKGQRSSRLSRGYRVIYEEHEYKEIVIVGVQEINKHEY